MAQRVASKYLIRLKPAPNLWWNIDKNHARLLVKKLYDDKLSNRPVTDPNRKFYKEIGKHGLSRANTLAAVFGYCMVGYHFNIDFVELGCLTYGTYKCALAANTYNQKHEITFDRQMERTRIRPLVKRGTYSGYYLALHHAEREALKSWLIGFGLLAFGCNPTVAVLGIANIALYYKVYTKLKRYTWFNTQVGAIVGAIPPLMGYLTNTNGQFVNIWWTIPVLTLFCWQFPHFYGLAESRNAEYAYAGYKMLGSTSPKSAMAWSGFNIVALAFIMAWAHQLYIYGKETGETESPADLPGKAVDKGVPYYCSYIYIGALFLAGMAWHQYRWWLGISAAAYTIFGFSTALISFVVMFQLMEQIMYDLPYWKKFIGSYYDEVRFILYRYRINL